MTPSPLFDAIGGIDSRFVEEALDDEPAVRHTPLRTVLLRCAAAAACVLLTVGVLWRLFPADRPLLNDTAVTVTHKPMEAHPLYPFSKIHNDADLSVSFSLSDSSDTVETPIPYFLEHTEDDVFSGTITKIDTLDLDFDGTHRYVLLAYMRLCTVYRGEFESGDEVTILLSNTLYEETDEKPFIVCPFKVGGSALLTAERLDSAHTWLVNGVALVLRDVAEYSFNDLNYCFIGDDDI